MTSIECFKPNIVKISAGTELNFGRTEDSDSFILPKDAYFIQLGPPKDGAIPVFAIGIESLEGFLIFWHQPEKPAEKIC